MYLTWLAAGYHRRNACEQKRQINAKEQTGRGEFDSARKAFDLVLEKYPENDKTVDAMFMKAKCLVASNQKRSAAREFRALIRKYPDTGLAEKAKAELKKLGY